MYNSAQRYKELGNFLKTRREKILPSQVGLPEGTRRRTPGLRREEVAMLAGIGLTWYTWLEQGRPIQVSAQVLESLARSLMLDKQEIIHLYTLAGQVPPISYPATNEAVNPMVQHVLDSLEFSPAMIVDARWNIIAWNNAAAKLSLDFGQISVYKRNLLRIMFTNDEYKERFTDWNYSAQRLIAGFRTVYGKYIDDPWMVEFVNELKSESSEFALMWSMHNVKLENEQFKNIMHPILGRLDFEETMFMISDNADLKIHIFTPVVGTDTKEKIKQFLIS
jgi:transcriptional regulator with XRE-family HTH domain